MPESPGYRQVSGVVAGPPFCGVPWLRRQLERHPQLRVPGDASGFWAHVYGESPDFNASFWPEAFQDLRPGICVECDEDVASIPSYKIGALAGYNPAIRVVIIARDPVARSWDALRNFHASHASLLGLGDGLGWVDEALASPDEFRDHGLHLMRDADYAAMLTRWAHHLPADQIVLGFYDELVELPELAVEEILARGLHVSPNLDIDKDGLGVEVDSDLPPEPPPAIAERLRAMHRRQVEAFSSLIGRPITELWS